MNYLVSQLFSQSFNSMLIYLTNQQANPLIGQVSQSFRQSGTFWSLSYKASRSFAHPLGQYVTQDTRYASYFIASQYGRSLPNKSTWWPRWTSRGVAHSVLNFRPRWGWVFNATPRPLYPLGIDPKSIAVGSPRAGLDGYGKSRHHRD